MRDLLRQFGPYVGLAAALHVALVVFLVVSLDRSVPVATTPDVDAIPATVIDEALVEAELARIQDAERRRVQELEDARRAVEQAAQQRQAEERRLQEVQAQREQETRQAQADRERQQREQREREQRQRAEQQRLAELERQRKAEEARLAELERQKQAEAERQRQAALERQRRETEERQRQQASEARQRVLAQYIADIRNRVERSWIRPDNWPAGTQCTVRVSQIPGGEVVQVRIVQSCGDPVLDRSVESAVLRASPLPTPADPAVFSREIEFVFRPGGQP